MKTHEYDVAAVRDLSDRLQWTPEDAPHPEASLARTWSKLNAITVEPAPVRGGAGAHPVRRRPRRLVPVLAGVLVLALAGGAALLLRGGIGGLGGAPPPAGAPELVEQIPVADAWAELAAAAGSAQPVDVRPGGLLYVAAQGVGYNVGKVPWQAQNQDRESWVRPDFLAVVRIVQHGEYLVDNDPDGVPGGVPDLYRPTRAWLAGLPTAPDALAATLLGQVHENRWTPRHELWSQVADFGALGGDALLPTALRLALYQVLADEEGLVAHRMTLEGRSLIAIQRDEGDDGQRLYFDATTGRLTGRASVYLGDSPGKPADGVGSWTIWSVGTVARVGERPS